MRAMIKVLRLLRKEANLSQKELADRLAVSRDLIARLENNIQKVTLDILQKYANYFNWQVSQITNLAERFEQPFQYLLRAQHGNYFTPELQSQFEEWYDRMEVYTTQVPLDPILELPQASLLTISEDDSHKAAQQLAERLRQFWNLGNAPLDDPVNFIEALGCYITGCDFQADNIYAVTGRRGQNGRTAIMINTNSNISIERQRFSIIHELGHILFHASDFTSQPNYEGYGRHKDPREKFTDEFTGNFLAPAEEIKKILKRQIRTTIDPFYLIIYLKHYFKVSYQTIIYRLRDLDYIDDEDVRALYRYFKARFGGQEPLPLKEPLIFKQEEKIRAILQASKSPIQSDDRYPTETAETYAPNPLQRYSALFGDYYVNLDELWDVLQKKRERSGEWDFDRLFRRLLEGLSWYELLDLLDPETIKTHLTENLIKSLYPPSKRAYYDRIRNLLHQNNLSTNGWLSAAHKILKPTILCDRWYCAKPPLPSA
jgi:Zn-dependent peptidase ImmA (M78 family)/DNA-binding XRE family transcriptional regulator